MKPWITAACCAAFLTGAAHAGSLSDPVITNDIIVEETAGSSSGTTLVALLALILTIPVLSD